MIIMPSKEGPGGGAGALRRRWVKRFDVFSLGWKQAERQTLRYSADEEHFLGASRGSREEVKAARRANA